jgi:NADH-dependent peroxiredoxin subunit C
MIKINEHAPSFKANAFHKDHIDTIDSDKYRGKWLILFFYPADFTFVCPTELGDLADHYEKFQELGAEIVSVSTDTEFVHKAWHDSSETIKRIKFEMLADPTGKICREYGTYIEDEGMSLRGTFIIDPDGILKAYEINDNSIGRGTHELLRKLQAAQFVRENGDEVCPVNWQKGSETLKPGLDLVDKI